MTIGPIPSSTQLPQTRQAPAPPGPPTERAGGAPASGDFLGVASTDLRELLAAAARRVHADFELDQPAISPAELEARVARCVDRLAEALATRPADAAALERAMTSGPAGAALAELVVGIAVAIADGRDVTPALAARDELLARLAARLGRQADATAIERVVAEQLALAAKQRSEPPPRLGINNRGNTWHLAPFRDVYVDAHVDGRDKGIPTRAKLSTDILAMAEAERLELGKFLDRQLDKGYVEARIEIDPAHFPSPEMCRAFERWRREARGTTIGEFVDWLRDPRTTGPKPAAPADEAGLRALANDLAYYTVSAAQLEAFRLRRDRLAANLVMGDMGDVLELGPPGFGPPTDQQRALARTWAERAATLVRLARDAGFDGVEIGNEPFASPIAKLADFQRRFPGHPIDLESLMDEHAARYALLAGEVYAAVTAGRPAGDPFKVNAAALDFSNLVVPAGFDPGELRLEDVGARFPPPRDELDAHYVARFRALLAAFKATPEHPSGPRLGLQSAMLATWIQAHTRHDPGFRSHMGDPAESHGFLSRVIAAQQAYFGSSGLMSDQINLHLYASPQENAEVLRWYAEQASAGLLPREVVVSEFGSQLADPQAQAADVSMQYATIVELCRGYGLEVRGLQLYKLWDEVEGWDLEKNGWLTAQAHRLNAPNPRP